MKKLFEKITIVGLGVVGGSYALALSKLGYTIFGVDLDEKTIKNAKELGCITDGSNDPKEFFAQSDLIIMALYPAQIYNYLKTYVQIIPSKCIVCDVAGLKSHFSEKIDNLWQEKSQFVFCHPMAGREKKGFEFADDSVFLGANFIITPTEKTLEENIQKISRLALQMGFGNIKMLTPSKHDEIIAYTSQLPHALAVALINSDDENANTGDYIGDSYRDLTRIANINEKLWSELFLHNKENLLNVMAKFECQMGEIKKALICEDKDALEKCFVKSTKRRIGLEKNKD